MPRFWMVRAGEGGYLASEFDSKQVIGVGWDVDFTEIQSLDQMRRLHEETSPNSSASSISIQTSMAHKFRQVMQKGDWVVTYDPKAREYLLGIIRGDYQYVPGLLTNYNHVRKVAWQGRVSRDALSTTSKNTLGSTLAIFEPGEEVLRELEAVLQKRGPSPIESVAEEPTEDFELVREDAANRSHEFIKDRILKLSPDDMEALTAALLRAMGYKTRVSPKGRDRGRDVVASPDGLGFLQPRIVAQVKHRRDPVSRETMLAFAGVLQEGDKALFVSTGGFSADAKFESERVRTPITLVDLDDLANLVVEYYEKFDSDGRSLLPLVRIYWPAS